MTLNYDALIPLDAESLAEQGIAAAYAEVQEQASAAPATLPQKSDWPYIPELSPP